MADKLQNLKKKIKAENIDDIYEKEEEWEYAIQDAFHKDCGLYLDSELFEIFQLKTKDDVIELIDALIQKVEQINGGQKAKKEAFNGAMDDSVAKYIYDTYVDDKSKDLYRGVPDVEFVYHGDWADPELVYQGKSYDYYDIEGPMWEMYNEDFPAPEDYNSDEYKEWEDRFDDYVRDNAYMVYDYLDNLNDCGAYYGGATYDDDELDESCGKKSRRKNKRTKKESAENMNDVYYEDEYIIVKPTGRNYDFIATIESKVDYPIHIEFVHPEYGEGVVYPCYLAADDWAGLLANDEGYLTLEAIKDGKVFVEPDTDRYTRENKRAKKESKYLREGPGAGYEIEAKGHYDSPYNIVIKDIVSEENDYGKWCTVYCDFNADVTFDKISFYGYYDGATLEDISANVDVADYEIDFDGYEESEITVERCEAAIRWASFDYETVYGGGWSHSTYDGTLSDREGEPQVCLSDKSKELISFIDRAVTGDNIFCDYAVYDEDDELLEYFDDETEAIEWAKANKGTEVIKQCWEDVYIDGESWDSEPYGERETIWERDYDKSYRYESRRAKTRKTEKTANRLSDKEIYDILGFDTDWVNESEKNKEIVRDCLRDFRELNKTYPENNIWLKSDVGVYTKGKVIDELGDLAVVQESRKLGESRIEIDDDELLDMLVDRLHYWTDEEDVIELYSQMYEDMLDNGLFNGDDFNVQFIVDNDWVNWCEVVCPGEDNYDEIK